MLMLVVVNEIITVLINVSNIEPSFNLCVCLEIIKIAINNLK